MSSPGPISDSPLSEAEQSQNLSVERSMGCLALILLAFSIPSLIAESFSSLVLSTLSLSVLNTMLLKIFSFPSRLCLLRSFSRMPGNASVVLVL